MARKSGEKKKSRQEIYFPDGFHQQSKAVKVLENL